jgi:prophage antirepressor-like protein
MERNKIIIFEDRKIRRIWHNDEWYYSIIDIVGALTDSINPRDYWYKTKIRVGDEEKAELSTICLQLKLEAPDGKLRTTDCASTEGIFRIIQSIPSPKAEPFKRWLAKVGYERIQEIEDPELAQERMKELYEQKGYSKEWIDKRLRGIAIRQELTDEWKNRGVEKNIEYAILTNEISKATFGKTVGEYKQLKELGQENLRDHMTDLELIFSMLGEKVTTEITQNEEATGFIECKGAAKRGGRVAGKARVDAEKEIGKPIVSKENYLIEPEKQRKLKKGGQHA